MKIGGERRTKEFMAFGIWASLYTETNGKNTASSCEQKVKLVTTNFT